MGVLLPAASFEEASGAKASLLGTSGEAGEAPSFAVAAAGTEASAEPGGAAAAAAPAGKPRFVFGVRPSGGALGEWGIVVRAPCDRRHNVSPALMR